MAQSLAFFGPAVYVQAMYARCCFKQHIGMHENDQFETSDLALAAALLCVGVGIEAVDHVNPKRAVFIFKRLAGLDDTIQAFWQHQLQVDPLSYFNCLKEAKTRLYGSRTLL